MAIKGSHRGFHTGRPDDPHGVTDQSRKDLLSFGLTKEDLDVLAERGISTHSLMGEYPGGRPGPYVTDEENRTSNMFPSPLTGHAVGQALGAEPQHPASFPWSPEPLPKPDPAGHVRMPHIPPHMYRPEGRQVPRRRMLDESRTSDPYGHLAPLDRTTDSRRRLGFDSYD